VNFVVLVCLSRWYPYLAGTLTAHPCEAYSPSRLREGREE